MANYKKMLERRSKDDEDTAFAFQEFIDTFQNVTPASKTFIKSGVYNAGKAEEREEEMGKVYNPAPIVKIQSVDTNKKAIECARLVKENKFERQRCAVKPKSNLELLKEELRIRHMDRDYRQKQKQKLDEECVSDDVSTNLFLTNLSPKLNEQDLMQICGVHGPLASVKIMWPRGDDRARNSNIGFVAYMSRKDSERAYTTLCGREDMRVSWGKPVDIPTQPVYIPPELVKLLLPPPYSGLPFNAQPLKRGRSYSIPTNESEMKEILYNSLVKVTIPLDKKLLMVVHRVIEFVIREGPMFEAMIMHKEINNSAFQFLFDNKTSTHVYYRWKLFSLMNGESHSSWSTKPFRMFRGGSIWIPPTIPDYTKGMDLTSTKNEAETLSDNQQLRLIQTIQALDTTRKKISEAMVFCLKHIEANKDVVNIISDSFGNASTTPMKKIARLYLISDILYNTKFKKPQFNNYHTHFEQKLQNIFEDLAKLGDTFQPRVLKVLRAWQMWRIFTSEFIDKLETIILGETADDSGNEEPLDGKVLLTRSMNYNPDCLVKQDQVIKVEAAEDIDNSISSNFIQSKWETLDPAEIESQAMSTKRLHDIEMERLENERKEKEKSVEYDKLRKIEIKVMKYQDDLEAGKKKLKKNRTIEMEVDEYRRKCIEKVKRLFQLIDTSPVSTDSFSSGEYEYTKKAKKRRREHTKSRKHRN